MGVQCIFEPNTHTRDNSIEAAANLRNEPDQQPETEEALTADIGVQCIFEPNTHSRDNGSEAAANLRTEQDQQPEPEEAFTADRISIQNRAYDASAAANLRNELPSRCTPLPVRAAFENSLSKKMFELYKQSSFPLF